MTRLRTKLGLFLAATALALPAQADELSDTFNEGVAMLRRGRTDEALDYFQRVLGMNPDPRAAYELWKATDHQVFLDMLVEGGQFELVAKRITELSSEALEELKNDQDAIRSHISNLRGTDDVMERRAIELSLAGDHGEYAVPFLLRGVADQDDADWNIRAMVTLQRMARAAVVPLVEALRTEDAFQRRNIATVLGNIADPRAAAALTELSMSDPDGGVVEAARKGAEACASSGDAVSLYLQLGDDYHHRRGNVLRARDYSDVVWNWDGELTSRSVPRSIYPNEMAKTQYYRALALQNSSREAAAGVARESAVILAKLQLLGDEALAEQAAQGELAVAAAGADALDLALQWSVDSGDTTSGVAICRALGQIAGGPSGGLQGALNSSDGSMKSEAAVALGHIAWNNGQATDANVISTLGEAAGRAILRIGVLIDANIERGGSVAAALQSNGVIVNGRSRGAQGLSMLSSLPGADVILVGDTLPDMTVDVILRWIASSPLAGTPVFLLSDSESAADDYADYEIAGAIMGVDGMDDVNTALEADLDGDRAAADALSQRAATILSHLAHQGRSDMSSVLDALAGTLASRPDAVTLPAMSALGTAGNTGQIPALVAVVKDEARSDEARVSAADAIAGICGRNQVNVASVGDLHTVLTSDTSLAIRQACARALGRLTLPPEGRAALINDVRVDVSQ